MTPIATAFVALPNVEQLEVLLAPHVRRRRHSFMTLTQRLFSSAVVLTNVVALLFIFGKLAQAATPTALKIFKRSHTLHLHYKNKQTYQRTRYEEPQA